MQKKTKKCEKGAPGAAMSGRVGGLAVAGGEVRRGKPSGTVRKNAGHLEPRQHPVGVRRIEDASRNRRPSKRNDADGLCESVQILCPGRGKHVLQKAFQRLGETIDRKLFGKASATETS